MQAVISFLSPIVSAALLTWSSIVTIFFIDVVTAAIAILVLLTLLKIPKHQKAAETQTTGFFGDFQEGLRYIQKQAFLKSFFVFFAIFLFLSAPAAFLTPLQVVRSFGDEVWRLTAIEIAFSAGMMAGGGIMAAWGGFSNRARTMALSGMIMGACTFALGSVPNFWIYLLFMAVCGIAMPIYNTPATVLLQEKVDENYLGRIFGVFSMIATSMMPLGMLLFGPVADIIAIEWLLMGTGVLILLLSLFLGKNRVLLEAGKSQPKDAEG
jgi:DHA3 family macrolide efflux protein-like MFS transporter